jgi:hypothetical protein
MPIATQPGTIITYIYDTGFHMLRASPEIRYSANTPVFLPAWISYPAIAFAADAVHFVGRWTFAPAAIDAFS